MPGAGAFAERSGSTASGGGAVGSTPRGRFVPADGSRGLVTPATLLAAAPAGQGSSVRGSPAWQAGGVTTPGAFRERLLPRWWAWMLAYALIGMIAIAYGAALGAAIGWLIAAVGLVLATALLLITAPTIVVADGVLAVGGARLPLTSIGEVEEVTGARIRELRGPGSDGRLFVSLRPWTGNDGVLVRLDDADDPHPAWLFTSRHPARVVSALTATMGR